MIGSKWARNGSQNTGASSRASTRASSAGSSRQGSGRIASHRLGWGLLVRSINAPIRCRTTDRADLLAIRTPKQPKRHLNMLIKRLPPGDFFTVGSNEPYAARAADAVGRWPMDAYGTARLTAKDAESAIVARICEDFNLTPVLARAHYEQMTRYFAEYGQVPARPGELCYLAVAAEEPAGKPIAACRKVQVRLELAAAEDVQVLGSKGLAAMRQGRLARLARQARVQGALLTVEDLAYLTCSSPATIKRDLAWLR